MSDQPIDPQFRATMNQLAGSLDEIFNGPKLPGLGRRREVGFALLTFELGKFDGGKVNYISNAERRDMIAALKELLARWEGRLTEAPTTQQ